MTQPADAEGALRIRRATASDVEALTEIYLSSARHHAALDPGFYRIPERNAVSKHLEQAFVSDDPEVTVRLVAEVGTAVVGSADVELRTPPRSSMLRRQPGASVGVAVLAAWRGKGVGSRLMDAAEEWAREHGATRLLLDASAENTDAIRFYEERHGYRLRGVLLTKEIGQPGGRPTPRRRA